MKSRPGRFAAFVIAFAILTAAIAAFGQNLPMLRNPNELKSEIDPVRGGDVNVTLDIMYADNVIPNPATGQNDKVHLRSYNGGLVGPTVRVKPGQTLRMKLRNKLPAADPSCPDSSAAFPDVPHCFNNTNLHTHGWHVAPAQDNVLLDIRPDTDFDYEYNLAKGHPAGTFWYHSHRHGSTALQVSSGMVGALIVEGDRAFKDKARNGIADVDTILKYSNGKRMDERLLVFEQIQYACGTDSNGPIWNCTDKVGTIESYNQFGPGTWQASGRFTLINGVLQPKIEAQAGKIERWRLIHAGVRDTIDFKVTRSGLPDPASAKAQLDSALTGIQQARSAADQVKWVDQYCKVDQTVSQFEFAVDGVTRNQMFERQEDILQPGYRGDLLVFFDKPGVYCVLDYTTPPASSVTGPPLTTAAQPAPQLQANPIAADKNDTRLLALVIVSGGKTITVPARQYVAQQLVAANADLPAAVKNDLKELKIPEFAPHKSIAAAEVKGRQELLFNIDISNPKDVKFEVGNSLNVKDAVPYDPNRIDRKLLLNSVDEWTLTSNLAGHPFHIHINPFEIISILDPSGNVVVDETNSFCKDGTDTQYCGMGGVFRDTLFIKQNYKVIARSRYERFIGEFVLHCHILDHEDQGMMQNIQIVPAGGLLGHPVSHATTKPAP